MTTPDQLTAVIRFSLNQLGALDRHHEFEHLCRHIARRRICSNILPATGPVASGGDQGRDFETFRTYLTERLTGTSSFIGLATEDTLVFSCTLQQDNIVGKIRDDVRSITSQGTHVDGIYAFCEANVAVALRHRLQDEVRENHDIRLEIIDGTTLAEWLSDSELFWIAQRYLDIPSEMAPAEAAADRPQWYLDGLAKWRDIEHPTLTHGEFYDLKRYLRHATFHDGARGDLSFWIGHMAAFESDGAPLSLQRMASYELVVTTLRGLETLDGQTERVERYFSSITAPTSSAETEDAQVLLNYLGGAALAGLLPFPAERVAAWRDELAASIGNLLGEAQTSGRKCVLLQTLGMLSLMPDITDPSGPISNARAQAALQVWEQLLDLMPEAPLFPIDRLSRIVSIITIVLAEQPGYRAFARRLDELVADSAGHSVAASRCRDRAMQLYKAERYADALREFHDARHNWFNGDTIRGSLLSSALIANCYEQLHLLMAAKYFWLSSGVLVLDLGNPDLHDLAGTALLSAAQCDYRQGAWFGFLELAEFGLQVHQLLDRDAMDYERHGVLQSTLVSLLVSRNVAHRYSQAARDAVALTTGASGIAEDMDWAEESIAPTWLDAPKEEMARLIQEQVHAVAFSDAGDERTVAWRALGITWFATFANTCDTTRMAEQFIAVAQIVLADLAGVDLCLLPTEVKMHLSLAKTDAAADALPSNDGRRWHIGLPNRGSSDVESIEQSQIEALTAVISVLRETSVLPESDFEGRIEDLFAMGIVSKTLPAKGYASSYGYCVSQERFNQSRRRSSVPFTFGGTTIIPPEHTDLGWHEGPGPTHSLESAREFLANRYERSGAMTAWTRIRLSAHAEFQSTLARLRRNGWLDWQIMAAVLAIAHHYRVYLDGPTMDDTEYERRARQWTGEEQADWPPVPVGMFTEDALHRVRSGNMVATLNVWELSCRQYTPDLPAIERFLVARYGYATDDIGHPDPFVAPVADGDAKLLLSPTAEPTEFAVDGCEEETEARSA